MESDGQTVSRHIAPAVFSAAAIANRPGAIEELAAPFIRKSISEDTRRAYRRVLREFFAFADDPHPNAVGPREVIDYRDWLGVKRRQRPNTVATKLAVVRSFFEYLRAGGLVALNPASTKLVAPPALPTDSSGRALAATEVRRLLAEPDQSKLSGARDYAIMLIMLRLSLRVAEVSSLRVSSLVWSHGRWTLGCKVKGGREETWPVPEDVKRSIDDYLLLDAPRRKTLDCGGADAYLFQPTVNYRTLQFDKPLSPRMIHKTVGRWGECAALGKVTPHDLRRSVVTKLLNDGKTYREVQMVTKHRDPKTVQRYDRARQNLDASPVNTLSWEDD